ncbi:hypothetical protein M758_7G030200 [Ceratodon purpureus]|nr:hypothetical protein M758_7G030200 [Ceratodon purpureus]
MEHHVSACKVHYCWCFLVAILFLSSHVSAQSSPTPRLSVVYTETPSNITSRTNATFGFTVVDVNGTNSCAAAQNCTFTCQLDQFPSTDCVTGRAFYSNLTDGDHNFSVAVNSSSGAVGASEFGWTIDTVAPTAVVVAAQKFTNAQNVTVNITFSETCENGGGFVCTNSSCDLWVFGNGYVIPSTLKELEKGRRYSLDVALNTTATPTGKVTAVVASDACADAAGNTLQRTNQSSFLVRFDRTVPSVNLWTAVPTSEVIINNQPRTCEATNNASDLMIYLNFDSPVTSSAQELLGFLSVSSGNLTAASRKTGGNRRFSFKLSNITDVSVVTVALAENAVSNRFGTPVPSNTSRTFFYDAVRPQVQVSTTSRAKTKEAALPFVVQFTEPVFGFNSSSVRISGGSLTSFTEIDRSTYSLEVMAMNNDLVTVTVPENSTFDVAGNSNLGSSSAQVRHYIVPSVSVVLYCLITVGLLSTALVSGMLSVSSSTLAAAGAIPAKRVGDPSRNLLGLTCHLQVLALSGFLAVSLPVEYQEVTNGLRWLIPHVRTPWQAKSTTSTNSSDTSNTASTMLQDVIGGRRRLLAVEEVLSFQFTTHRGRALGDNATLHGPPLGPGDYQRYFLNQVSEQAALKSAVNGSGYNGWQEFQRNMFWIGVVGGGLILIHILMVVFLRWRTRAPIKGALTIPRFELYLLILIIPGLCQASAFVIRGGSPVGIAVGGLLLAVPAAFLLSILIFLVYGVFMGMMVQYREYRFEVQRHGYAQPQKGHGLINLVAGTGFPGKWVRSNRLTSTFLPRYGLIFEDHKGPPTILVHKKPQNLRHSIKRSGSTAENGDSEVGSGGSNDVVQVSDAHRILGDARAAYILVDLSRRITLGLVFGFFSESDHSWSQVGIVLGVTAVQLVYLVVVKPFRRRGVQVVETIALLCELGVFVAALALLAKGNPTDFDHGVGIFMVGLLLFSFVAQLVNEWYALLEQLMRLSTAQEPTLNDGLKKLAGGLVLPFTPRHTWAKFIGPQAPKRTPSSVVVSKRRSNSPPNEIKPFPLPNPDSVMPPQNTNPTPIPAVAQIIAIDVDSGPQASVSEEIRPEPSPRSDRQISRSTRRASIFSADGRRSRGGSHRETDSEELKILRELAKASFPGHRRDADVDIEQGTGAGSTNRGTQIFSAPVTPVISPREVDENRYMRKRRQFQGMPNGPARSSGSSNTGSGDSISAATPEISDLVLQGVPMSVPEMAHLVGPPTMSNSSPNKLRPGHVQSHSMNVRDSSIAPIRPLDER